MRYEIEPNQYVIRLYEDDSHPDTYYASALIRTYGDIGFVSSISSPRFFEWGLANLDEFLTAIKVESLQGYMSKAMARALRMGCKGKAKYQEGFHGECAGREMPWISVSRLEDE
jgi:hypothetical protein